MSEKDSDRLALREQFYWKCLSRALFLSILFIGALYVNKRFRSDAPFFYKDLTRLVFVMKDYLLRFIWCYALAAWGLFYRSTLTRKRTKETCETINKAYGKIYPNKILLYCLIIFSILHLYDDPTRLPFYMLTAIICFAIGRFVPKINFEQSLLKYFGIDIKSD
ncbi:hypothetical protein ACFL0T_06125 [Candidatus Omnitrophota bacterium]